MQFRIRTLLAVVTVLALALAVSGQSPPERRVGIVFAVCAVWLASGLTIQSLRRLASPVKAPRLVLVCLSLVLAACALGATVCLTGLMLLDQFPPFEAR